MKQILLFLLCLPFLSIAQIVINPNPADINAGIITITYGSQGDYTLFDPMSDPNLLLYTGLETDGVASTWDFHDDFSDTSTMVPFNFDTTLGYYIAQIDVAGRTYLEEPNLNVTTIPSGTQVNDWYFLIATTDLSRQSADLKGSDYGWQPSTLSTASVEQQNLFEVVNNQLIYHGSNPAQLKVHGLSGVLLHSRTIENSTTDLSFLPINQLVLLQLETDGRSQVVKHIQ